MLARLGITRSTCAPRGLALINVVESKRARKAKNSRKAKAGYNSKSARVCGWGRALAAGRLSAWQ